MFNFVSQLFSSFFRTFLITFFSNLFELPPTCSKSIQQWRDRGTQSIFYHDVEANATTWTKPDGLLFDEQSCLAEDLQNGTDREWGLVRLYYMLVVHHMLVVLVERGVLV
jgi:hypothetical protein